MDKQQLEEAQNSLNNIVVEGIRGASIKVINPKKRSNFSERKDGKIGNVLRQRHEQRAVLFWFSLIFVTGTTFIVFMLIIAQAQINAGGSTNIKLIDNRTLQIIVTGVFVQFVGLVGIITKSIWNDKPYLDAGVMKDKKK